MRSRTAAILFALALLTVSCGARLTQEQRDAVLSGGVAFDPAGNPVATNSPGAVPTDGATNSPGAVPTGGTGSPGAPTSACAEGENKASDTGVTADQIKIGVVVDLSGVQTGLFTPAKEAMQAWAAMVNNAGGICGRTVAVDIYDTGTNSGGNQSGTRSACNADFAIVGSMSAFDGGGYDAGNECGIPAIPAISTNAWKSDQIYPPNYYPAYPQRPDYIMDTASYVNQTAPDVKSGAAAVWLNQPVARTNMASRERAYEQAGFEFVYRQEAQVTDPNYASYVSQMKNHNPPVKYLTFVGNYQSAENMLQAMDQQQWHPDFIDFDSVVYSPLFLQDLKDRGITTTNLFWFINTAMFEESGNAEMDLYRQWLAQVAPGKKPDFFGLYAWSAGRLFQEVATKVGPNLTRKAFLSEIAKVAEWDSHGLHGPHLTGQKLTGPCYLYGDVRNYTFHRIHPGSGWKCDRPTRKVPYPTSP